LAGETYTITWTLDVPPSPAEITVVPASRQLTAANYALGRNFTVTAVDDAVADGTTQTRINFFATSNFGNTCQTTHILVNVVSNE
jgi:hypothetical protein